MEQAKDNPIAPEPRDYRAPSWSWASVDGKVTLYPITDTQTEEISVEILEAKTFSIVGGEMGQLTHGHINLRGTLRPAHMAQFRPDYSTRLSLEPDGKPTTSINVWPDNLDNIFPATVKDFLCSVYLFMVEFGRRPVHRRPDSVPNRRAA
jgi:hypothetical protein